MSISRMGLAMAMLAAVAPASAQLLPGPIGRTFPPALQNYLELSLDQVNAIQRLNAASAQFQSEKLRRFIQVQSEIAQETAKSTLDAMALGVRYLELEAIRREITADNQKTYSEIQRVLNDAQKTKVRALAAALQLQGVICEAQSQNVLPGILPGNVLPIPRTPLPVGQTDFASFLLGTPVFAQCSIRSGNLTGFLADQAQEQR